MNANSRNYYYCYVDPVEGAITGSNSDLRLGVLFPFNKRSFLLYLIFLLRIIENPVAFIKKPCAFRLFGIWKEGRFVGDLMYFPPSSRRNSLVENSVEVSFCILMHWRGKGIAASALMLGLKSAIAAGCSPIALVRFANDASNKICGRLFRSRFQCERKKSFIFSYYER